MDKTLTVLRGLPSSGKSFVAEYISSLIDLGEKSIVCSADDYFYDEEGAYNFDGSKIKVARGSCFLKFQKMVEKGEPHIIIANTNTEEWEFEKYMEHAKNNGYTIISLIVENRHGNKNDHQVPAEIVEKMKNRFDIKL